MSVGTSDTTVISSTKTEARNLNAIDASAAQRDDSSPAPKNRQKQYPNIAGTPPLGPKFSIISSTTHQCE